MQAAAPAPAPPLVWRPNIFLGLTPSRLAILASRDAESIHDLPIAPRGTTITPIRPLRREPSPETDRLKFQIASVPRNRLRSTLDYAAALACSVRALSLIRAASILIR